VSSIANVAAGLKGAHPPWSTSWTSRLLQCPAAGARLYTTITSLRPTRRGSRPPPRRNDPGASAVALLARTQLRAGDLCDLGADAVLRIGEPHWLQSVLKLHHSKGHSRPHDQQDHPEEPSKAKAEPKGDSRATARKTQAHSRSRKMARKTMGHSWS